MKIEVNTKQAKKITVSGLRGASSRPFEKTFRSFAGFEKWLEANGEDCQIFEVRGE